ncbi:MAG: CTP synthase (glutamine hydrolyzing) [Candidatus Methanofastidiosa archaeon]|nr:CTP synthase (glutamine hydrolyzing) [Candidatus Methanofastidiosa archaeon]
MKYVVVTGGVISGLGKGVTTASIAKIIQSMGHKITVVKIDPYVNVDAGTMSPFEHGEVFVLDDGGEVDLDLGNYERFLNIQLTKAHNITTGKVYLKVIEKERKGDYLGKTVQIIPHITDEIKAEIRNVAKGHDVTVIEVGGTVGDIESMPFLEALRQLSIEEDVVFIHVTLVPNLTVVGEPKTKPTQHSVKALREVGISPHIIVCRSAEKLNDKSKEKIALFTNVRVDHVISAPDVEDIHYIPLIFNEERIGQKILDQFKMDGKPNLTLWKSILCKDYKKEVNLAIVGKYADLHDSYLSISQAIKHASFKTCFKTHISWIEAEDFENKEISDELDKFDGVLVPGGFGSRGVEGKINVIKYARQNNIPYLGICLGFQLAVIEYARNVCNLKNANTTEVCDTPHPVIDLLPEQKKISAKGGTMRLGASEIILDKVSMIHSLYNADKIYERHRHRYEVNRDYIDILLKDKSLIFTGKSPNGLMEVLEIKGHPFFLGTQFHPEFKSRVESVAPTFYGLVKAMGERK